MPLSKMWVKQFNLNKPKETNNTIIMTMSSRCPSQVPRRVHHLRTSPVWKAGLCGDNCGARRAAADLPPCQVSRDEWRQLHTQHHHVLSRHAFALQQQAGIAAGQLFHFVEMATLLPPYLTRDSPEERYIYWFITSSQPRRLYHGDSSPEVQQVML